MATIVNQEETIGKTVGTRQPPNDPFVAYARLLKLSRPLRKPLPYPRGVFLFKTHEEADAWKTSHILKAAKDSAAAPTPPPASTPDPLAPQER